MNKHWQEGGGDIPTPQLKTWVRGLRGIDPPDGLREKLVAAVPPASARQAGGVYVPRWPKALRYFAAAAVIGIAFVVVRSFVPQTGSPRLVADINDRSGAALVDHNNSLPGDINISDHNTIP